MGEILKIREKSPRAGHLSPFAFVKERRHSSCAVKHFGADAAKIPGRERTEALKLTRPGAPPFLPLSRTGKGTAARPSSCGVGRQSPAPLFFIARRRAVRPARPLRPVPLPPAAFPAAKRAQKNSPSRRTDCLFFFICFPDASGLSPRCRGGTACPATGCGRRLRRLCPALPEASRRGPPRSARGRRR